jgi:hypothetical protein
LAVCLPSLALPVTARARPDDSRATVRCWRQLASLKTSVAAPFDPLGRGSQWNARLRDWPRRSEAPSVVLGGCEVLLRRSMLPAWLSTRGGQLRAPSSLVSLRDTLVEGASALLELARPPRPLRTDRLREAIPDASGRLMQPTLSKTSTHASGSQRRRCRRKPGAPPSPVLQRHRTHFCQRTEPPHQVFSTRHVQPGAGFWRLVTARVTPSA